MFRTIKIILIIFIIIKLPVFSQDTGLYNLGVSATSYDMVIDGNNNIYVMWKTGFQTINVGRIVDHALTDTDSFTASWNIHTRFARPRMSVKPDGTELHTCFISKNRERLIHVWRDSGGDWHQQEIWTYAGDGWYIAFPSIGVDAQGYVHVMGQRWKDGWGSYVQYWRKTSSWTGPTNLQIPSGTEQYRDISLNVDSEGGIHGAWKSLATLGKYRYAPSGGNLATSTTINIPNVYGTPTVNDHVAVGETCRSDNGDVHHIYFHYTDRTYRHAIRPGGSGSFNSPIYVAAADNNETYYEELIPSVGSSQDGRIFSVWAETKSATSVCYVMLAEYSGGNWSSSVVTDQADIDVEGRPVMAVAGNDIHIIWNNSSNELMLSTITGAGSPAIAVLYPQGGEQFGIGDTIPISWTTENISGNVEILLRKSDDSGGCTVDDAVAYNSSPYNYIIPGDVSTGYYFVRVQQGGVSDDSGIFEIVPAGTVESITVTYPNGGEVFTAGDPVTVTWTSTGSISDVSIEFSSDNGNNWMTLFDSVPNTGSYTGTIPPETPPSSSCLVRIADAVDGSPSDTSDDVFTIYEPVFKPWIELSRSSLNFGSDKTVTTQSQSFVISNSGAGVLNWTVSDNRVWLTCSPTSGTELEIVTCTVNPSGLGIGTYTGTVTVSDSSAGNSPQTVQITLKVYNAGATDSPFGSFDTPANGSNVFGSIPVTGWVLDDIEVTNVQVKREPVASDDPVVIGADGLVFIGNAVFVEGARPDVETLYPSYPLCYRAGWGYMLLTNTLPDGGNGTFVLHAVAFDKEGNRVDLGARTIHVDNASSVMPFGAIDTPDQGGTADGVSFVNFGWALTPLPSTIVTGTTAIDVVIDSVIIGNAEYGDYRSDIEAVFPGYNNSDGAGGHFYIDTTSYDNGVHTISWNVRDDADHVSGIGSRYFTIINTGSAVNNTKSKVKESSRNRMSLRVMELEGYAENREPVSISRGIENGNKESVHYDAEQGGFCLLTRELERLVVYLGKRGQNKSQGYRGYMKVGQQLRRLPVGSTLDKESGIFYWEPAPGFFGEYTLIFINDRNHLKRTLKIGIKPKF